ncbi:MAG TPA: GNAT family N-acetyltransferase [Pseudolabrys sp.]|nr:GNAT family N-acetyltransferase [Pseudolabrys sp.]
MTKVRQAVPSDVEALARLWYDGWQDAHAAILPAALARTRTLQSFADRLRSALNDVWTLGSVGGPQGFYIVKGDELYQFYVTAEARGRGVAQALMTDVETRARRAGIEKLWLACAIGNDRAARFYEKCGWQRVGPVMSRLDTLEGPFDLEVWRYEWLIGAAPGGS